MRALRAYYSTTNSRIDRTKPRIKKLSRLYTQKCTAIQKCESKNTVVYPVKATLVNYTGTPCIFVPCQHPNWKLFNFYKVIHEKVNKTPVNVAQIRSAE